MAKSARQSYGFRPGDLVRRRVQFNPNRAGYEAYVGASAKWFREFAEEFVVLEDLGEGRFRCQRTVPPPEPGKQPWVTTLDGQKLKHALPVRASDPIAAGAPGANP